MVRSWHLDLTKIEKPVDRMILMHYQDLMWMHIRSWMCFIRWFHNKQREYVIVGKLMSLLRKHQLFPIQLNDMPRSPWGWMHIVDWDEGNLSEKGGTNYMYHANCNNSCSCNNSSNCNRNGERIMVNQSNCSNHNVQERSRCSCANTYRPGSGCGLSLIHI